MMGIGNIEQTTDGIKICTDVTDMFSVEGMKEREETSQFRKT